MGCDIKLVKPTKIMQHSAHTKDGYVLKCIQISLAIIMPM